MSKRPNFYRLLRLDPSEDSWPAIERRIEEVKRKSNTVSTDAAKGEERESQAFKIYLGEKGNPKADTIYVVMQDSAARKAEAKARREELLEEERLSRRCCACCRIAAAMPERNSPKSLG